MENLNGFELAGRPMKVGHVTERMGEAGMMTTAATGYTGTVTSSFGSSSNLDSDDLDNRGISLGATGRLALMAKLSEGSGLQMPKHAMDALQAAHMQAAGSQHVRIPEPPNPQQLATVTAVGTQCFMLSNMFDPAAEAGNPKWVEEIRDEVIEECNKFGGVVHIYVDEKSPDGNVYVKCATIASGTSVAVEFPSFVNFSFQLSMRSILFMVDFSLVELSLVIIFQINPTPNCFLHRQQRRTY